MLNIYCGKTLFDGYKPLMKRLESNRKLGLFDSHIFIVPDRYTMACEKDIFDYLNIESTFDIRVLTLSRFASEMLEDKSGFISKNISCMIIQRLLYEGKQNLKCFNKTKINYSFASEIYNTINQLKSSKITPEEITLEGEDFLALKMHDIKYIYTEYEKYLQAKDLVDSAEKFTLFEKYIDTKNLKNTAIYISHFDSFTKQGYSLIKKFVLGAGQVNISVAKSDISANSHIYLNDVYSNVLTIAAMYNIEPTIIEADNKLEDAFEHIKNNLFAYKPSVKLLKNNNITLSCHTSEVDECEYVAVAIRKLLSSGVRQKDIAIAVPSLDSNKERIKKVFDDFEFNSFFDTSATLTGSIIDRLFESITCLRNRYFKQEDLLKFIKNPLVNLTAEFSYNLENYIIRKGIEGKSVYRDAPILNEFRALAKDYFECIERLNKQKTYKDFIEEFENLFEKISLQALLDNMTKSYIAKGYLERAKITAQIYDKVTAIMSSSKDILGNIECSVTDFYALIKSGFEATKISVTPVSVDSLFIGDASKSLFEQKDYLFVMGAKEGQLPFVASDCGMITDKEIAKMSSMYKIEPTIETINLRERFKLYNMLLLPNKALHISYAQVVGNLRPASFVTYLQNMFVINTAKGRLPLEMLNDDYNYFSFVEKLGARPFAEKILSSYLRNIEDGIQYTNADEIGTLFEVIKQQKPYIEDYKKITCNKRITKVQENVFFTKGTISVSEVESYYSCPFKHYINYGLKLKENKVESFDTIEVGNFLHKVAELFVKDNIKAFPLKDVKTLAKTTFDKVLHSEEYVEIIDNIDNKLSIISIEKEALRMCEAINYQIANSNFRPILTEARFDKGNKIESLDITIGSKTLRIVGAIDRIDECKDYFRIIDYKTGRCDSSLKELYYGKKLQLYVYQKVVCNGLKLKPAGAYYFPVKNSFINEGDNKYISYRLKGYTDNNEEVIKNTDATLANNQESSIVNVSYKKGGGMSARSEVLTSEGIETLADYAMKALCLGVKEILNGNISASPFSIDNHSACEYCPYKAICRYDEQAGDSERIGVGTVDIDILKEGVENGD